MSTFRTPPNHATIEFEPTYGGGKRVKRIVVDGIELPWSCELKTDIGSHLDEIMHSIILHPETVSVSITDPNDLLTPPKCPNCDLQATQAKSWSINQDGEVEFKCLCSYTWIVNVPMKKRDD